MSRICAALVGAGLMFSAVGCGGGGSPEGVFKEFQAAIKAKDGEKAWGLFAKDTQNQLEGMFALMKGFMAMGPADKVKEQTGMTPDELKAADGKKIFTAMLKSPKKQGGGPDEMAEGTLEGLKVEGDKATATVKHGGKSDPIAFVKEGGSWKISLPMTPGGAPKGGKDPAAPDMKDLKIDEKDLGDLKKAVDDAKKGKE